MSASPAARFLGRIWFRALRREGPPLPPGPCLILLNHPKGCWTPFRHSVLLRFGPPIPWEDLAGWSAEPEAVTALTSRIRTALKPLTLHDADVGCLALAQEVAGMGRPILERGAEDLPAVRGFLRRHDPAVPERLEARRQLLEAFPELGG